jgi:hypothetical protein
MSYDLVVFEPSVAPTDREQFREWFDAQTEWTEEHGYNDPSIPSLALRNWYQAILAKYPNLQNPDLSDDEIDLPTVTDYSLGGSVICCAFRWTIAEQAYDDVRRLAVEHHVGFYDVSGDEGDGEIYFPGESLRPPSGGAWRDVSRQFRELEGKI